MPLVLKPLVLALAVAVASPAGAACYADYKAKQDRPLRLHYGVMEISDRACDVRRSEREIAGRLRSAGWTLLNVISVFGPEGLNERNGSAGEYFLRY